MAYIVEVDGKSFKVEVEEIGVAKYRILLDGKEHIIDAHRTERDVFSVIIDGRSFEVDLDEREDSYEVSIGGDFFKIYVFDEKRRFLKERRERSLIAGRQVISAPMPGKVIKILVKPGERVRKGSGLVVIEAMKMENEIRSPIDGEVKEISIEEGRAVEAGEKLVVVE